MNNEETTTATSQPTLVTLEAKLKEIAEAEERVEKLHREYHEMVRAGLNGGTA